MNKYKELYSSAQLQMNGLISSNNALQSEINYIRGQGNKYEKMLLANDIIINCNRFIWENLPINLTSQQLESLFYQYGALCFFKNKNNKLQISKFTVTGQLNDYGILDKIKPISFSGKSLETEMAVMTADGDNETDSGAIIIYDYTPLTSWSDEMSRMSINKSTTIQDEINVYRQLKNVVKVAVKKALIACETEEQKNIIKKQAEDLLNPDELIAVIASSKKDTKSINNPVEIFNYNTQMDAQNYCQLIDYYNKVRRNFAGIPSPDTFEKKERKIAAETEDVNVHTYIKLYDGLMQRTYGLELMKKYIKIDGIDKITVRANELLLPKTDEHNIPQDVPMKTHETKETEPKEPKKENIENE